ncbi:MAG: single-stranded DNA-binding protein [Faecousia sp.]
MLNHITLMGRLTRDPELRFTPQNTPVASFSLAVERDYQPGGSERQTDFIDCVAWRKTAEFVSKHFQKGSMAVVSGRLQIRDWTDRDGGKRRSAEVAVDNIYFAERKPTPSAVDVDVSTTTYTELAEGEGGELPF